MDLESCKKNKFVDSDLDGRNRDRKIESDYQDESNENASLRICHISKHISSERCEEQNA